MESLFLKSLFAAFDNNAINYAVMRNYQDLPESTGGSDLDLLMDSDQEEDVRVVVGDVIAQSGGVVIGSVSTIGLNKLFILGKSDAAPSGWWGVRVDILFGMKFLGVSEVLDPCVLTKCVKNHNGVKVLSEDVAAVIGVVKEVIHNACLPSRYLSHAAEAIERRREHMKEALAPVGEKVFERIERLCLETLEKDEIAKLSREVRHQLLLNSLRHSPKNYVRNRWVFTWSRIRRLLKPPGKVIALLGVDGAGKSTLIDAIRPVLARATHNGLAIEHLRPNVLPPLSRIKGRRQTSGMVTDPHGQPPSGKIMSYIRLCYYMTDYIAGYWIRVRPFISRSPKLFIFDRYAYDFMLDPRRFRVAAPNLVLFFFGKLAPKPNLIICLHGDAATLVNRKKELPIGEIQRQILAIREFANSEKRAKLVSTDESIEASADEILFHIRDYCRQK